ncbi:protein kinase domain containing protein [Stylonychia lemnae]|uniref:non-specific serine/threonine protein kinase n=1 Tax=Stylonychia lemnae TaxID=5949 RepID=A0A077ZRX1_STYLE|nr:protein kinase domain containing protein [Stylonychia lemnae]|eukprot:CDW72224.1 protein kinase domain containing protein [Stylonychia lemnae]
MRSTLWLLLVLLTQSYCSQSGQYHQVGESAMILGQRGQDCVGQICSDSSEQQKIQHQRSHHIGQKQQQEQNIILSQMIFNEEFPQDNLSIMPEQYLEPSQNQITQRDIDDIDKANALLTYNINKDHFKSSQVSIQLADENILDVQINQEDKLVVQNKEVPISIKDIVKNSIVTLPDHIPNVLFSSSMQTQVYVLDYHDDNLGAKNLNQLQSIKIQPKTQIKRNEFQSQQGNENRFYYHSNLYQGEGEECPKEDENFENKIEFQESQSTIVTKIEYHLTAVDRFTGQILFNVTKSDYSPHFNLPNRQNFIGYQEFLKNQNSQNQQQSNSQEYQNSAINIIIKNSQENDSDVQDQKDNQSQDTRVQEQSALIVYDDSLIIQPDQEERHIKIEVKEDNQFLQLLRHVFYLIGCKDIDNTQIILGLLLFLLSVIIIQQMQIRILKRRERLQALQSQPTPPMTSLYVSQTPQIQSSKLELIDQSLLKSFCDDSHMKSKSMKLYSQKGQEQMNDDSSSSENSKKAFQRQPSKIALMLQNAASAIQNKEDNQLSQSNSEDGGIPQVELTDRSIQSKADDPFFRVGQEAHAENNDMQLKLYNPSQQAQISLFQIKSDSIIEPEQTEQLQELIFKFEGDNIVKEEVYKQRNIYPNNQQTREFLGHEIIEKNIQMNTDLNAVQLKKASSKNSNNAGSKNRISIPAISKLQTINSEDSSLNDSNHIFSNRMRENSSEMEDFNPLNKINNIQEVNFQVKKVINKENPLMTQPEYKVQFKEYQNSNDKQDTKDLIISSNQKISFQKIQSQSSFKALPSIQHYEQTQALISKFLENGRFKRQFVTMDELGRGGFGVVYKVKYALDDNIYAIKKIKLHLGVAETLQNHKVYREIQAITKLEPKNIIRYYTCWIEGLDELELQNEKKFVEQVKKQNVKQNVQKKNLKQIRESQSSLSLRSTNERTIIVTSKKQAKNGNKSKKLQQKRGKKENSLIFGNQSIDSSAFDQDDEDLEEDEEDYECNDDESLDYDESFLDEDEDQSIQDSEVQDIVSNIEESKRIDQTQNIYDGGSISMYTLQQLIRQEKPYISLNLMIQTEYCSGQTLKDYLMKRGSKIDRHYNFKVFSQLVNGVATIHDANIIHRDLKPENIFLDEHNTVKIGDFGLARAFDDAFMIPQKSLLNIMQKQTSQDQSGAVGTPLYFSPEQLQSLQNTKLKVNYADLGEKIDIYSLGLILLELSSDITTTHEKLTSFNFVKEKRKLPPNSNLQGTVEGDLIMKLTQIAPEKRPCIQDIRDEWLPKWQVNLPK